MLLVDSPLTASQVLHAFHRDEIFLFLGAAFTTVGLVISGFLIIRRRFDALLFWLAIFAILYGNRLWMTSELLGMIVPPSGFFEHLKATIDFFVPIPAFLFFQATGFMGRPGKVVTYISCVILFCLLVAASLGAPLHWLYTVNSIVVICALLTLVVQSLRHPMP